MAIIRADGQEIRGSDQWERWVTRLGVPLVGLILVVYFFVWPAWDKGIKAMPSIEMKLDAHMAHSEQLHANMESYMRIQLLLLRQMCTNSAKTLEEKRACFQP